MATPVPVTGWHLTNTIGSHRKFYTVLIADNGVVVTAWGRIGSAGQSKIDKLPEYKDAEALGKRQVYGKQTGGYQVITDQFTFTINDDVLGNACARSMAQPLLQAFEAAKNDPAFAGERQVVMKYYDEFVAKAQRLLNDGERPFEEVHAEFEELKEAWNHLSDKHDEVRVTVDLAEQLLAQRLMSGMTGDSLAPF